MPKINVYLPDDLADAVRDTGLPVSPICQRALEHAVRRITTIHRATLTDLDPARLAEQLPSFTERLVTTITLAATRATGSAGAGTVTAGSVTAGSVTTGDLLHGLLTEGHNLALRLLNSMDVAPSTLTAPTTAEPGPADGPLRFSTPAAIALELAVGEAIGLGHNYVGCEHLLIGLAAEPDGAAGALLRSRAVDGKAARRTVAAALEGYAHLRATNPTAPNDAGSPAAVLTAILQRLEAKVG
ncbi:MAG TPA: Clp protease N-terminal domain-containing protein [Actinoplanes sp.]|nr:Clp protease N-terminal domain-containing protein [Actinoplanes sp.]